MCGHADTNDALETCARPEEVSLASPSRTDPKNHSGTSSGKDPLQKPNHHSLLCAPMPVGKQQSGGQRDHSFKLCRPTTRAEASE